jgi:two-component SAPR family response regulator
LTKHRDRVNIDLLTLKNQGEAWGRKLKSNSKKNEELDLSLHLKMTTAARYLIIDDDRMTLFLCSILIRKTVKDAIITTFEKPKEALRFIAENYPLSNDQKTVLLLDINMSILSGWDFIQELLNMDPPVIEQFCIYIQSSSVDSRDLEKASSDPYILDFISKPLKKDLLSTITSIPSSVE